MNVLVATGTLTQIKVLSVAFGVANKPRKQVTRVRERVEQH